ncbi:MAG: hypothetical protein J1F01_08490 [Oscillospiraceae bacterium]|nr:hypothetical protein [Oscillospiraceae bacterium]
MMEDIYLEYIIKRKKTGAQKALVALVVAGGIAVSLALLAVIYGFALYLSGTPYGSFTFSIGLVLIALLWYGMYLIISMQNVEYEYILTNSEMDIDKIMSKKGRKHIVSFDFKEVTICASITDNEHNHDYKNVTPGKVYNLVGDASMGNVYYADFPEENTTVRVLFQPTHKMISSARRYNPRNIFVEGDL